MQLGTSFQVVACLRRRAGAANDPVAAPAWCRRSLAVGAIFSALLCGLGASGQGIDPSTLPSNLLAAPNRDIAPILLIVDTIPSGAQAQIRKGMSCQTPCELTVTPMGPFKVDFTLKGYEPQSAEIVLAPLDPSDLSAGVRLDPNPLTVELKRIPRASPPPKQKPAAKQSAPKSSGPENAGAIWPPAR
jgi:hypothetical protein